MLPADRSGVRSGSVSTGQRSFARECMTVGGRPNGFGGAADDDVSRRRRLSHISSCRSRIRNNERAMTERPENEAEARRLLAAAQDLSSGFSQGLIFIGGLAVSEHARARSGSVQPEFTYDGDFYLALQDFSDLRDIEDVVPNRRLNKHQITKSGFEFDIYVEGLNTLAVPFADIAARSTVSSSGLRVAALEHLLVLKSEAALDRKGSAKGDKDMRDVAKLLVMLDQPRPALIEKHISAEACQLVASVGHQTMLELTGGNAHRARQLTNIVKQNWGRICAGLSPDLVPSTASRKGRDRSR